MDNIVIVFSTNMDCAESESDIVRSQVEAAITLLTTMPFPPSKAMVLMVEKIVKNARHHNRTALVQVREEAAGGEPARKKIRVAVAGQEDPWRRTVVERLFSEPPNNYDLRALQ